MLHPELCAHRKSKEKTEKNPLDFKYKVFRGNLNTLQISKEEAKA